MKSHITLNQLKQLLFESDYDIVDLGNVLRMEPCEKQKKMCFNYPGYIFVHKEINPDFQENKPYILIVHEIDPKTKEDFGWSMHYHGFENEDVPEEKLNELYVAIAKSLPKGFNLEAAGGVTPGGLSGISKLANFGFKKEFHPKTQAYWTATTKQGGILDLDLLDKWLNSGKHDDEFIVVQDGGIISPKDFKGKKTMDNTEPKSFSMIKQ